MSTANARIEGVQVSLFLLDIHNHWRVPRITEFKVLGDILIICRQQTLALKVFRYWVPLFMLDIHDNRHVVFLSFRMIW